MGSNFPMAVMDSSVTMPGAVVAVFHQLVENELDGDGAFMTGFVQRPELIRALIEAGKVILQKPDEFAIKEIKLAGCSGKNPVRLSECAPGGQDMQIWGWAGIGHSIVDCRELTIQTSVLNSAYFSQNSYKLYPNIWVRLSDEIEIMWPGVFHENGVLCHTRQSPTF